MNAEDNMAARLEKELGEDEQFLFSGIHHAESHRHYTADDEVESGAKISEGVTTFRGITFDRWLLLITQVSSKHHPPESA